MKYDAYMAMLELNGMLSRGIINAAEHAIQRLIIQPLKGGNK